MHPAQTADTPLAATPGNPVKPARPWLAFILGTLLTGWGLLYAGRPRLAVAVVAGLWVCLLIGGQLGVFSTPQGLLGIAGLLLSAKCISAVAGTWLARRRTWRPTVRNQLFYLAGMGCLLWLLLHAAAWPYLFGMTLKYIKAYGMAPTVQEGDLVVCAAKNQYQVGDIVVYDQGGNTLVKRVAGTGGDTVELVAGNLRLNGHNLGPFYASSSSLSHSIAFEPTVVGADQLFVLGDNRDRSRDSRMEGPVSLAQVQCKVTGVVFSPRRGRTGMRLD